jgi:hypothetical protein
VSVLAMADLFFVRVIKKFDKCIYLLNYVLINDFLQGLCISCGVEILLVWV